MRHLESQHGRALVQWWGHACKRWGLVANDLHHVPNERSNKKQAMRLSLEGVRAGIPDYFLSAPFKQFAGLWIELKSPNGGRLTVPQKTELARLRERGFRCEVCIGWMAAQAVIEDYLDGYKNWKSQSTGGEIHQP